MLALTTSHCKHCTVHWHTASVAPLHNVLPRSAAHRFLRLFRLLNSAGMLLWLIPLSDLQQPERFHKGYFNAAAHGRLLLLLLACMHRQRVWGLGVQLWGY